MTFFKLNSLKIGKERRWEGRREGGIKKKTKEKSSWWKHVASEKKSELPLGTNIAQQAFCYMSKAFDFHSRLFISLWFGGNKSEAPINPYWLWRSKKK